MTGLNGILSRFELGILRKGRARLFDLRYVCECLEAHDLDRQLVQKCTKFAEFAFISRRDKQSPQ